MDTIERRKKGANFGSMNEWKEKVEISNEQNKALDFLRISDHTLCGGKKEEEKPRAKMIHLSYITANLPAMMCSIGLPV